MKQVVAGKRSILARPCRGRRLGTRLRRILFLALILVWDGPAATGDAAERVAILVGAKVANALNHPVFFSGSHFLDDRQFGRISSVLVGARVIEFRLHYNF